MTDWRWIGPDLVFALHDRQLAEHGGLDGIRDRGAIESALARPQNRAAYQDVDAADLAAAYAFGLARSHGFADGNKRTAWVVARLFLADNGCRFGCDRQNAVTTMVAVAVGEISETALADWFRRHLVS
ncbi:MAG: type II toxin-antitoxin system death-on-curing family toxin [Azospirillaceae bacterium]|nr:type II toxin-antitoxin system death-on-curing family toxin [Azospirillaceae bacterium]